MLGKRTCPTFEGDNDEVAITGADNCLIKFAMAEMYRRERQIGKCRDVITNEATPLLAQLIGEQVLQQAHFKQMLPTDGFGAGPILSGAQSGTWV